MRWAVFIHYMNGVKTFYTVDSEDRAKELAQATKDSYKGCRVFVGYEVERSPMEEDDTDTK